MDALEFYGRNTPRTNLTQRIQNIWLKSIENVSDVDKDAESSSGKYTGGYFDPFVSTLLGPTVLWKTFPKQIEALQNAKDSGDDLWVFAYESPALPNGARRYLVTSYEHFWHKYSTIPKNQRCLYEVIQEDVPVKLYFDLEFGRDLNPSRNGEAMVDLLISEILKKLEEFFGKSFSADSLIQLDASTSTKFSQHLIFPSVVFADFRHAGYFVDLLCEHILLRPSSSETFSVKTTDSRAKGPTSGLFIDRGVYTKNRNFRLYLSSKLGKDHPLLIVPESPLQDQSQREIFFLSLICNVPASDVKNALKFEGLPQIFGKAARKQQCDRKTDQKQNVTISTGYQESPFPQLDVFINEVITVGGYTGRIRQWQFFEDTCTIVYAIAGDYKYCARIGRHHKSNNIIFVVEPERGTYHQKCLDPDCKLENFRSHDYLLPFRMVNTSNAETKTDHAVSRELDPPDGCLFLDTLKTSEVASETNDRPQNSIPNITEWPEDDGFEWP